MKLRNQGLTLVETLVCLVIVGILILLAIPPVSSTSCPSPAVTMYLSRARQLSNALQALYVADFEEGKLSCVWASPNAPLPTVAQLTNAIVTRGILTKADLEELLFIPGKPGEMAFTIYAVTDDDPIDTIFISTKNWHGPSAPLSKEPFGNKSFALIRKAGDGQVYRALDATNSNIGGRGTYNFLPLQ